MMGLRRAQLEAALSFLSFSVFFSLDFETRGVQVQRGFLGIPFDAE